MKNYLLTLGVTALTVTGFAQSFSGKTLGGAAVNGEDGKTALSKTVGKVELLDGSTVLASGSLIKDGYFALGTITDAGAGSAASANITVHVWDSSVGGTYAAALAAGHGYFTSTLSVTLAYGATPPIDLTAAGFAGGSLKAGATPEPSTYALAALGLGGLLFISRRK